MSFIKKKSEIFHVYRKGLILMDVVATNRNIFYCWFPLYFIYYSWFVYV